MKGIDLIIRPLSLKDINSNYVSWFSDNVVTKYLDAKNISILESQKYLRNGIINRSYYIYAICEKKNKKHIGNIKIGPIRRIDGVSDLVTVIGDKNYWGKGLATQALKLIINKSFAEGGLRKFCASIDSNNQGSFNAYLKAGFKLEAKLKKYFLHNSHISKNYSDKLYVTIDNLEYDIEKFRKWEPVSLSDII